MHMGPKLLITAPDLHDNVGNTTTTVGPLPAEDLVGVRGCDLDVAQGGPLTELEPRREVAQPYTIRNTNYSGEVYLPAEILIHDLTMAALKKKRRYR